MDGDMKTKSVTSVSYERKECIPLAPEDEIRHQAFALTAFLAEEKIF
jgi:hypothetical protein